MKGYVDQRLIAYENHVEDLISASIREERAACDKAFNAYTTGTREDLKRHMDNKIKRLTKRHENENSSLKQMMENRIAGVEQKVSRDLAAVEHAIDQQIHQVTAEKEEKMSFAVQKHQQTEHEKGNELLTSRIDEAIEAAIHKLIPRIKLAATTSAAPTITARTTCTERLFKNQIEETTTATLICRNGKSYGGTSCTGGRGFGGICCYPKVHPQADSDATMCGVPQQHVGEKDLATESNAEIGSYPYSNVMDLPTSSTVPGISRKPRHAAKPIDPERPSSTKQSRLEQVRASSKRDIARHAAERAAAPEKSHKLKTRSQKKQHRAIV